MHIRSRSTTVLTNSDQMLGKRWCYIQGSESSPIATGQREVTTGDGVTREQLTAQLQVLKESKQEQAQRAGTEETMTPTYEAVRAQRHWSHRQ